jgi:hypothetical protein
VVEEMAENMALVRDYSYFWEGQEKEQRKSDKVLEGSGLRKNSWEDFVMENGPLEVGGCRRQSIQTFVGFDSV